MVVDAWESDSPTKVVPATANGHQFKLQVPLPLGNKPLKKELPNKLSLLVAECIADEMAHPGVGVSAQERAVWGSVFQSRQNFVDMHCC
ncbi:hypothetical protein V1264_014107 [Littorina saxatilis]|uniref:Uncharacterized protein n=1 Tax=Littorina saxatilis TaxID=31220 RepID=A0AAN9BRT0_9CAEN